MWESQGRTNRKAQAMNTEEYQTRYGTEPDYIDADGDVYDDNDLQALYDNMLNESGPLTIGGNEYNPAEVLNSVDPTAYRVGMSDYQDTLGWDEWSADHEWIEDEDEDEDGPVCEDCFADLSANEIIVSLSSVKRLLCEDCGKFEA